MHAPEGLGLLQNCMSSGLEDEDEYEVEGIREDRTISSETYFLVKWKGRPSEYNQWVPQEEIGNATEII